MHALTFLMVNLLTFGIGIARSNLFIKSAEQKLMCLLYIATPIES